MKYILMIGCLLLVTACSQQSTKPSTEDTQLATDQPNNADTTVITYQEGDNTIEERRIKGFIYSVKVTPKHGKPYYLVNADGDNNTLKNGRPQEKIPSWTLFSW
ncbi:DUF2782 domain-containing protein [Entomomonas sp. E2T0]|uniref:DUF2782 domain-containing protein n=1 Tax=Entomomonas sp. E2T0 TaxID=2930213 RepID=UPI002228365F|nr:DUF2782 domain-containing protein [Entomomonas sp. E2T0]UYZ84773.1 DUF2782 domain-containing protein [Entomomonas sp. E2T0]